MWTFRGRLTDCLLLSYRTPAESVRELVPAGLQLITRGPWAFWNVVACRVEQVRPEGVPQWAGLSYHHVAYRLLTRCVTAETDFVDGLYFVRSEADHSFVTAMGRHVTDFKFRPASIAVGPEGFEVSRDGVAGSRVMLGEPVPAVEVAATWPADSCFPTLKDAQEFLRYRPVSMAPDGRGRARLAEVSRDDAAWRERVVNVVDQRMGLFDELGQSEATLELATAVDPIEYQWKLGRTVDLLGYRQVPAPQRVAESVA
ncbi:MAG: DUF2071 domain-containing protein [Planctomycetota bacterium]